MGAVDHYVYFDEKYTRRPSQSNFACWGINISQSTIEATRAQYGLNDAWFVQYFRWIGQIVQFDFGTSYQTGRPVLQEIVFMHRQRLRLRSSQLSW